MYDTKLNNVQHVIQGYFVNYKIVIIIKSPFQDVLKTEHHFKLYL